MAGKKDIVRDVLDLAGDFVIKRKGEWDHEGWESFVKKAGKAGADISDFGQVKLGALLEAAKSLYCSAEEPAPVKAEKKPKAEKPAKAEKAEKPAKAPKVAKPKDESPAKPAKKKAAKPTSEG
jgi:outer membrane biosynthesis protein TonB